MPQAAPSVDHSMPDSDEALQIRKARDLQDAVQQYTQQISELENELRVLENVKSENEAQLLNAQQRLEVITSELAPKRQKMESLTELQSQLESRYMASLEAQEKLVHVTR